MGMFDYFFSSYDLGEGFTRVSCQSKDFDQYGIGGSMSEFWLSPGGGLYVMTYRDTHTFEVIEEGHPDYKEKLKFLNFEWVPTGKHGKVQPYRLTAYVKVYPSTWDGEWEAWPRLNLHFKDGRLVEYRPCTRDETF